MKFFVTHLFFSVFFFTSIFASDNNLSSLSSTILNLQPLKEKTILVDKEGSSNEKFGRAHNPSGAFSSKYNQVSGALNSELKDRKLKIQDSNEEELKENYPQGYNSQDKSDDWGSFQELSSIPSSMLHQNITQIQKKKHKIPFHNDNQSDELQSRLSKDAADTRINYQSSINSSSSSTSSGSSSLLEESRQPNPRRYCVLNSVVFPSTLHQVIKHKFISATIGIDKQGRAWVSGITEDHKSILINPRDGKIEGSYNTKIFLNQHQAVCIFQRIDLRKEVTKEEKIDQKEMKHYEDINDLFFRFIHIQVADFIDRSSKQLHDSFYEIQQPLYGLDQSRFNQMHLFGDGVFLYPAKTSTLFCSEKKNTFVLQDKAGYQPIEHGIYVAGNVSKHIFIRNDEKTKKIFVDDQDTGIAIPEALLDAKDICYKLNANGNVLLSIANQGRTIHVINLDTKDVYGPFVSTQLNSQFLDASFWYEETLVLLEQSSNGTVRFLKLNYEEDNKELKTIASLEHQPIFHRASFLHNLRNVNEVVFFGITAETKELHTGILDAEADPHPIPCDLFSSIIDQYHGENIVDMKITKAEEVSIGGFTGFGYDSEGHVHASSQIQIVPVEGTSESIKSNPLFKLTKNKVFFRESWAVVLNNDNKFLLCQASTVIEIYNKLISTCSYNECDDDLVMILGKDANNSIGSISFSAENSDIYVSHIYPNGSFMISNGSTKDIFIEYNLDGIPQITLLEHEKLCIRIPSLERIFRFKLSLENEDQKEHIQVTLNRKLLKGPSQHMPVNYEFIEVNESGTTIVATFNNGCNSKIFVYDLENDCFWYVHGVLPCHIKGIHFLDDQNLLFFFEDEKNILAESSTDDYTGPLLQHKIFIGTVSVASSDAQCQVYKPLNSYILSFPPSKFVLIKKKHKEQIPDNDSAHHKPITIKDYYLGYKHSYSLLNSKTLLGELRVVKHEYKFPIIL